MWRLPTMSVAMPTATIAGAISERFPVISATMIIVAMGMCPMLPKLAIMPTMTNGAGLSGTPGAKCSSRRQTAAPTSAPMTMPGPKMPPEPPEPIERLVARILAKGRSSRSQIGKVRMSGLIIFCTQP